MFEFRKICFLTVAIAFAVGVEAQNRAKIPLAFGPWKLHGLPGLILKADADGGFSFMATGLQTTDRLITPMYSASDYSKTERKKAQAQYEYYINNMEAMLKAQHEGLGKI